MGPTTIRLIRSDSDCSFACPRIGLPGAALRILKVSARFTWDVAVPLPTRFVVILFCDGSNQSIRF